MVGLAQEVLKLSPGRGWEKKPIEHYIIIIIYKYTCPALHSVLGTCIGPGLEKQPHTQWACVDYQPPHSHL